MSTRTTRQGPPIQFRDVEIERELAARGDNPNLVAKRDLERYYALLRQSLPTFSRSEASLIVDALNGTLIEPHTARLLWAAIDDALYDGLAEKWGVDGLALVARLRRLTPFEALAVVDAAERYWRDHEAADALERVGLVSAPT